MATADMNLANSLIELQKLQNEKGIAIVKSTQLSRVHLARLVSNGFLQEAMKGWYIPSSPSAAQGDTTNWYTSFWYFVAAYANSRFDSDWCLTPEQSIYLYSGGRTVPPQVTICTPKGSNNITRLLHNTSLLDLKTGIATPITKEPEFGLNLYSLPEALTKCSADLYRSDAISMQTCLSLIPDASRLLSILLEKGQTVKAGRLAGAFRAIGNPAIADEIIGTMKSLGYDIREENPFATAATIPYQRVTSPYATRIKLMWDSMREVVIQKYPASTTTYADAATCLQQIEVQYKQDAYNSLSIEGYKVTPDLIAKVQNGQWEPEKNASDFEQKNAMAAKGYFQAFQAVKESVKKIVEGQNAGTVAGAEHNAWYRALFAPSVSVGLLKPTDLAGYRTSQVYIKGSMHTPLHVDAVRDAMPVLFQQLEQEPNAAVRAILGHFFFVYIHPYMDGNGRVARFLMNTQFISGGYNWTIVPVERKQEYIDALEKASTGGNITPFVEFIASISAKEEEN